MPELEARISTESAYGSLRLSFEIDSFYKMCLLQGLDDFGYILKNADAIRAFELKNGKR